ncbi:hypothetical protein [Sulfurovum sp. NBC37-1]|uniref:hypothetical protein n=1 Tax=Sulfurovum sp. (strain NBC37-1) TaxID=387093 RepID=UPI0001587B08|nr:hypothetical protein [Sulfurovum sp. NBC37-1]BAF73352.1 hypothetical protein SUN_2416 [Sulfurovum sp. NBC37-1]
MTPEPLHRPFIGISICQSDYSKVKGLLPSPSYTDTLYSRNSQTLILIYEIEGYITSPNQYRWISNIKLGLQAFLCVAFKYVDEFHITDTTEVRGNIYTISELSKAFKAPMIIYPDIMYPSTKQELYKRLCWYGQRLIHQRAFTKEAMTSAALQMNDKLDKKYQPKELHKKALGAYMFIDQNRDRFRVRLNDVQLKEAHSKGGQLRRDQRVQQTKERVQQLLKSGDFLKPNGKANLTALAKAMNMTRKTVAKYV